ncbi:MAG TPA: ParB N-terminal domain-containing protein [Planctomycetaceae bacterium]|nr:ParB N-terminal domain-containing protein [Planctomycetaceae bacterium]
MHIETIPLSQLIPAPYNPRKTLKPGMPAYQRLERSLAEFELVQPIVWNRITGHVVGGHQRLEILKRRGDKTVECVVVELTLEREKALNVALNNDQVAGEWDAEKLTDLVADLQALPDFDATLTGFDADDLRDLLLGPQPLPPEDDEEEPPVVRVTLEIPPDEWEAVRPAVDALLAGHRDVRAHVRLPSV